MEDNFRHKGLRKQLINLLREKGIKSEAVLDAMGKIPRHLFLDTAFLNFAYEDKAFPIGAEQTISHPYTVAFQTELLELARGEKVLEIGSGCGYQTAVLCELGVKVYSIERQKELYDKTKRFLPKLGYRPNLYYGDGYLGKESFAPFDKIIITCGAPFIPEALLKQLKVGGIMIIPVGEEVQEMIKVVRVDENNFEQKKFGDFKFVPMLADKNK